MFPATSSFFLFSFFAELLAQLKFNNTMGGQLRDIKKVCIFAENPDHWLSFWMSHDLNVSENRLVTFHFQVNSSWGGAVVDIWPPGPEHKFDVPWVTIPFKDYPRNRREFLYYFTIYEDTLFFTLVTAKGVQTVILYIAQYLIPPPVWMYIVCKNCTGNDTIYYSTLNFGKNNSAWWKLEQEARTMSPYYGNTTEIMDDQTKMTLKEGFPV